MAGLMLSLGFGDNLSGPLRQGSSDSEKIAASPLTQKM
jgi:hypothetical protein